MKSKIRPSDEISKRFNELLKSKTREIYKEFSMTAIGKVYNEYPEQNP